jgi:hypothetical protein
MKETVAARNQKTRGLGIIEWKNKTISRNVLTIIELMTMQINTNILDNDVTLLVDSPQSDNPRSFKCNSSIMEITACSSRRCVRFLGCDSILETISITNMTQDEIDAVWWTSREKDQRATKIVYAVEKTRRKNRSFVATTIGRSYKNASSLVDCSQDELSLSYCHHAFVISKSLQRWVTYCEARRGLEKFVMEASRVRRDMVDQHRQTILALVDA